MTDRYASNFREHKKPELWVRIKVPNAVPTNDEHLRHVIREYLRTKGALNSEHIIFDL